MSIAMRHYITMKYTLKKAALNDIPRIWEILQQAILRRKRDGSAQWQNGYPNPQVIASDIDNGVGYLFMDDETRIGYAAILVSDEPAYDAIEGKWLTNDDFLVVHRVAIADEHLGKGLSAMIFQLVEKMALEKHIHSIKVDTNFDNIAMLKILERLGYVYCGEVYFNGSARKAFQKVL
jgi:GNAT superfamily N-acetyltransferase